MHDIIQEFIEDKKRIPTVFKGLKKNSFIFDNFQYVSSTLNFNNGGYEKTCKNYIRSFHKSIKKSGRIYSLLSSLTHFENHIRERISKGDERVNSNYGVYRGSRMAKRK